MKQNASASSYKSGRTTLILFTTLCFTLTSCQTGVYRDTDGYLKRVPDYLLTKQVYPYPSSSYGSSSGSGGNPVRAVGAGTLGGTSTAVSASRIVTAPANMVSTVVASPFTSRKKSTNVHDVGAVSVLPPVPEYGYSARWDTRPVQGSPNGLFWVVNPSRQISGLPPDKFWPFWSKCVSSRVAIRVFKNYDPGNRFPGAQYVHSD